MTVCLPQISFNFFQTSPGPFPSLIQASIWAECKLKLLFCIDQQTTFPKEQSGENSKEQISEFSCVCPQTKKDIGLM